MKLKMKSEHFFFFLHYYHFLLQKFINTNKKFNQVHIFIKLYFVLTESISCLENCKLKILQKEKHSSNYLPTAPTQQDVAQGQKHSSNKIELILHLI